MLGSRTPGAAYVNTTGRPILIMARVRAGTVCQVFATINGVSLNIGISSIPSGISYCIGSAIVPNGATYTMTPGGFGGPALEIWYELR